jgi:hypothetical protein
MPYVLREFKEGILVWESSTLEDNNLATSALVHLHKIFQVRAPGVEFKLYQLDEEGGLHEVRIALEDFESAESHKDSAKHKTN